MRFVIRKYVDADNAADALRLDKKTKVHEVYLKDGEEPSRHAPKDCIGFYHDVPIGPYTGEPE